MDQIAASIETLQAKQTNLGFKLSKLAEREDDLADTCMLRSLPVPMIGGKVDPTIRILTGAFISTDVSGRPE